MYSNRSNLILGFHGCELSEQEKFVNNPDSFKKSQEDYDWLGHGMYFWEHNEWRALQWANEKKKAGTLEKPASIGAVIDLGYCLDLLDSSGIESLKRYYKLLKSDLEKVKLDMPENKNHPRSKGNDRVLRYLDCAVIEYMHNLIENSGQRQFDSIRAAFIEGDQIYPGAGFNEKTHIQICIRNPNCIKGYFIPRSKSGNFSPV